MAECYECGNTVDQLSKRSRCVDCEYERSIFNEAENERLRQRVSELEEALRKIVNPIAWFQQEAEKTGDRLDGMTAHRISEDPHWLKQQAQQALAALAPQEGE
jgi:hypothetical protein